MTTSLFAEDSPLARRGARLMHTKASSLLVLIGLVLLWASMLRG